MSVGADLTAVAEARLHERLEAERAAQLAELIAELHAEQEQAEAETLQAASGKPLSGRLTG